MAKQTWSAESFLDAANSADKTKAKAFARTMDDFQGAKAIANDVLHTDDPHVIIAVYDRFKCQEDSIDDIGDMTQSIEDD